MKTVRLALTARASIFALAAFAASLSSPVRAQEAQAETADGLPGEIVVTAQRRAERLQDVPITLTTIDSEQLDRNNARTLADIAKLTPAVRIDYQGSFAQPTIRGVGTAFVATGTGSNVGIYIDGFYSPISLASDFQLLNVASVQVLKGPQGTLFGRNTTGGAILVTTSAPSEETRAEVQASYGSFNTQRYQGYATGGLGEGFAVDIAALYTKGDGYVRNILTGSKKDGAFENWSVRVGAKAELSDDITLTLRYTHADTDDPAGVVSNAFDIDGVPQALGTIIPGTIVTTKSREVANARKVFSVLKTNAFQLAGEVDLGFANLTSYTQYRKDTARTLSDIDFTSAPIFDVTYPSTDKVLTQELLFTSKPGGPLQWTAGVFYLDWKNRFRETLGSISGGPLILVNRTYARTWSIAGFADVTYQATDHLFVTVGGRYSKDVVDDGFYESGPGSGDFGEIFYPKLKSSRFTPRLVARYELNDASSVFASYTAGYKAALINMSGPNDRTIKPEKLNSFEIGYKYVSRAFSFDASAYYYDYKNLQSAVNDRGINIYTNAANSEIYGVEAQVRYQLSSAFEISAGAGYLDAKYKNYPSAVAYQQCLDPSCGADFGSFLQVTVDASGFRMIRSPKFTGNVNLTYTAELAGGQLRLGANLYHTSTFFFDTSEQYPQKAYSLLGLRAEWADPSERFTLAIFGDNVTDEKYRRQALLNSLGIGSVWGPPATIGGSIRARF